MSNIAWVSNGRDRQQPYSPLPEGPPTPFFNSQEVRDYLKNGIFTETQHLMAGIDAYKHSKISPPKKSKHQSISLEAQPMQDLGGLGLPIVCLEAFKLYLTRH